MAVLRLDRFTTGLAGTAELLTQHAAAKEAFPGLIEVQPVPGREAADPCGGRDPRRRAWPAPPLRQLRRGAGRAMADRRGDEQA
jgi:hypothetical protein